MCNLVLVAGGLGSRLSPITNHIPKFLVNIGKNTGYVEQIRYWSEQMDLKLNDSSEVGTSLTVIVHPAYARLVTVYHNMYFPEIELIVKTVDVANGSAHAILSTCDHLIGRPVMFSWCDVIPAEPIDVYSLTLRSENVVFTNYNNSNRYEVVPTKANSRLMNVELSPTERGGCFGLYYIAQYKSTVESHDGQDFIEILNQYGALTEQRLEKIIDFGDMPKLIRTRSHSDEAREFNSVEFIHEYVLKTAMNKQGEQIIAKEVDWYSELGELLGPSSVRPPVPEAWISPNKKSFFMSRALGVPIWKAWPDLSPVDRRHVLQQVIDGEQMLFDLAKAPINKSIVLRDVSIEADKKLHDRYNEIRSMVNAFGPIRFVNGFELSTDPFTTIAALSAEISQHYMAQQDRDLEYGFIHGDLQFSNSMVDLDTLKVTIIDPRGYFGKTALRGLQDYDIGKLLYALSGYDTFNQSKTFGINRIGAGHIEFDIPEPSHEGIQDIIASHFKPIHHLWLAVCFIGLAQYIKNDPVKSVCAHYHGLALAEKILRKI